MDPKRLKAVRLGEVGLGVRIAFAARASYFFGLHPVPDDNDKPDEKLSYKSACLIPKDAPKAYHNVINQAIVETVKIGIEKKWGGKKPPVLQLPKNDGNQKALEDDKYAEYKGNYHMTLKKPAAKGRPILKAHGKVVTEPGVIESGDWCLFDISFYAFANKKKGVACGLNAVTLIEEGERFGGGPSEDSVDDVANDLYGDLVGEESASEEFDMMNMDSDEDDDFAGLL